MDKLLFKEEQYLRQNYVTWIIIPAWLWSAVSFGQAFYQQLYLGRPWGDKPISDNELLLTGIGVILLLGLVFALLFRAKLITEVHSVGLFYKFIPFVNSFKSIPVSAIASFEVKKYHPLLEYGGWGLRFRWRNTAYNVSGSTGLVLILKNGKKYTFGTKKPDELRRAVEKMMKPI